MDAATPAQSSNLNFKQLLENNADVKQLIENNAYLKKQIETLDAEGERARQIARLHQSLDTLTALTVKCLRTTDPAMLQSRVGNAVDVLDDAIKDLKGKILFWEPDDIPHEGQCNPGCYEPVPYCCNGGCYAYPC